MGEPCHDIMAIFREAAAADKVCLQQARSSNTHIQAEEGAADALGAGQEKLETLGSFRSLTGSLDTSAKAV